MGENPALLLDRRSWGLPPTSPRAVGCPIILTNQKSKFFTKFMYTFIQIGVQVSELRLPISPLKVKFPLENRKN